MSRAPEVGISDPPAGQPTWLARAATVFLALAALVWVASVIPTMSDPAIPRVAGRVTRGESYDPASLRRIVAENLRAAVRSCVSSSLRNLLILQIKVADDSGRGTDLRQADLDLTAVDAMSKALLACAPTESIGWLGVYWSDIRQEGFGPQAATYLAQSYRRAPHEAWIQLIRAPLALRSFDALPSPLRDAAVRDFEDIYQALLFPSAAALYRSAAASARERLLDGTCGSSEDLRQVFRHYVEENGSAIHHRCYPTDDRPAFMRGG